MTLKVGITGGIGSGKSMVCKALEALGYPVYYADLEAKYIVESDKDVVEKISSAFGSDIYISGKLDRKKLASLVFVNKELLDTLNKIVHPAVEKHFENWVCNHSDFPIVFEEAAIVFESGANYRLDKVIGVVAPPEIRIERVIKRDKTDRESVINRMKSQMDNDELKRLCDYTIVNDGKSLVFPQITSVLDSIFKINRKFKN